MTTSPPAVPTTDSAAIASAVSSAQTASTQVCLCATWVLLQSSGYIALSWCGPCWDVHSDFNHVLQSMVRTGWPSSCFVLRHTWLTISYALLLGDGNNLGFWFLHLLFRMLSLSGSPWLHSMSSRCRLLGLLKAQELSRTHLCLLFLPQLVACQ